MNCKTSNEIKKSKKNKKLMVKDVKGNNIKLVL